MKLRVKNFAKFQHFKDRSPPWIKLYRDILDDPDWHELDGETAKILMMLWLIASEDEGKDGNLPDSRKLCFRLRIKEPELQQAVIKLSHWVEQLDTGLISDCYQLDAPEKRREETETRSPSVIDITSEKFDEFWTAYGKPVGKKNAFAQWRKTQPNAELAEIIIEAAKIVAASTEQKFRKDPERWLRDRRWEDHATGAQPGGRAVPEFMQGAI